MFKIIPFVIAIFITNQSEKKDTQQAFYTLDNPSERVVWERIRLADPITGAIPKNIRKIGSVHFRSVIKKYVVATWICLTNFT